MTNALRNNAVLAMTAAVSFGLGGFLGSRYLPYGIEHKGGPDNGMFKYIPGHEHEQIRAFLGSTEDSLKIINIMEDCASGRKEIAGINADGCAALKRAWSVVDAENGGTMGQSLFFDDLAFSKKCLNAARALFWARKIGGENYNSRISEVKNIVDTNCNKEQGLLFNL